MRHSDPDDDIDILKLLLECVPDEGRATIQADLASIREQRRATMSGARVADIARGRARTEAR